MNSRSKSTKRKVKGKAKFITRTIKVNTPYVTDGYIKKKYLNAAYLKENILLAEPRLEKVWTAEEVNLPFVKPMVSPYEAVSCSPKRNKFPHVKSKYMADVQAQLGGSKFFSPPNTYVVG